MFSGNTYTFMHTEKYIIYKRPNVIYKHLKKTQPILICKPKLKRTISHDLELNQLYNSTSDDKENCQTCVSDDYRSSLGLEMWSSSWE